MGAFFSGILSSIGTKILKFLFSEVAGAVEKYVQKKAYGNHVDDEVKAVKEVAKRAIEEVEKDANQAEHERTNHGKVSEETEQRLREKTRRLKSGLLGPT